MRQRRCMGCVCHTHTPVRLYRLQRLVSHYVLQSNKELEIRDDIRQFVLEYGEAIHRRLKAYYPTDKEANDFNAIEIQAKLESLDDGWA